MRATVRLTLSCNNHCIFCAQRGLQDQTSVSLERRIADLRAQSDQLTFVGGEPGLVEELTAAVRYARSLGFVAMGLQTNGARLAERAATLAQAGLTDVHISLHGATAAE